MKGQMSHIQLNLIDKQQKQTDKLLKLAIKAENCTKRDKAQRIIRKADKAHKKLTKLSEGIYRYSKDDFTPIGSADWP